MKLTFNGINAAIMIASSARSLLPEKLSSVLVLMSLIGRANLLMVTVTNALMAGMDGVDVSETYRYMYGCLHARFLWWHHLLALGKSSCDMLGAFVPNIGAADVQRVERSVRTQVDCQRLRTRSPEHHPIKAEHVAASYSR